MRRTHLTLAAAAFVAGGITTGALLSYAQPPPATAPDASPAVTADDPLAPPPGPDGRRFADGGWMHWRHHPPGPPPAGMRDGQPFAGGPVEGMRAMALVFRQEDRALTPADVQKIAEAFLLWNGNHTWKVIETAARPDGRIGFTLATSDGSPIAKFVMDPHTARLTRIA